MNNTTNSININEKLSHSASYNLLKIIAINVNSIQHKTRRLELISLLDEVSPDIALLSETKLYLNHVITLEKYYVIRIEGPHSKQRGETAIIISKNIDYEVIGYPTSKDNVLLKYTIVKIKLSTNQHFKNLFIISF